MAQLAEHPTLGFGSGHDPWVRRSSPTSGSELGLGSAKDSLSSSAPPHCTLSLTPPKIKLKQTNTRKLQEAPGWLGLLSVRLLVSAQVMISGLPGLEPLKRLCGTCLGFSLSPSLSVPPPLALSLSLSNNK